MKNSNPFVPLQLRFFEETGAKLERFLRRFQTDKLMVPFLVSHFETIIREMYSKLILNDIMEDARSLIKLSMSQIKVFKKWR